MGLESSGGDAIDRARASPVVHLVAAHNRVEPVGHVDRAVGSNGDV